MNHFKGKEALAHVIDARMRGKLACAEIHGTELPGHLAAGADAAKESAFYLLILWILMGNGSHLPMLVFVCGLLVWKIGRSAILGWSRLERLHRVIEEERYEIEHHRAQEKEELKALYAAKGFSHKLLDEVVEVLMADDNRLLQVMLEEELGLNLGSHEHPLKQAFGALIGVIGSAIIMSIGLFFLPSWGGPLCSALVIACAAALTAHLERNRKLPSIIWNLAIALLGASIAYFFAEILL